MKQTSLKSHTGLAARKNEQCLALTILSCVNNSLYSEDFSDFFFDLVACANRSFSLFLQGDLELFFGSVLSILFPFFFHRCTSVYPFNVKTNLLQEPVFAFRLSNRARRIFQRDED